ncbi:MAG: sensor histidine kinase, partial [Chitinophagaceae bacterium]|nr:sensor histidine kinase [Rubrivivax sp.]
REGRLLAEQRRSTELARSNAALRQSLDALAGTDGEGGFLRDALLQLQTQTGAVSAYLFRAGDTDARLRLIGRASAGQFSEQPAADDPEMFFREFDMDPELFRQLRTRGSMLWRKVDRDMPITADTSQSTLWHLRMGHKANAVHALMVGERQVGFIGMLFDTPEPLPAAVLDHAHALCQPITLALELTRLSRLAQRSSEQTATLKERNRLAREIHDGIAQSFLAIQMQLDTFDDLGADAAGHVKKALEMSRHGLAEARRAVAALRPQGLQDSGLPGGIQRLLSQYSAGSAVECGLVSSPGWQALPGEVEDHLYRIVQEALNNAQRHAQARSIRVELSQAAGETTVLIADDGVGFDMAAVHARRGFGLESMQQRAQLISARIDWLSHPGKGTQVLLSWTPP